MTRVVLLDTGPLGLLTAPPNKPEAQACSQWLANLIEARHRVNVPEITNHQPWPSAVYRPRLQAVQGGLRLKSQAPPVRFGHVRLSFLDPGPCEPSTVNPAKKPCPLGRHPHGFQAWFAGARQGLSGRGRCIVARLRATTRGCNTRKE
jgi:hypothetical protein